MIRERKSGWGKRALGGAALLAMGLALAGVGCSDSDGAKPCLGYACGYAASLPENTVTVGETTQIDVHLCFEADCRNSVIDLARPDASSSCAHWVGSSFVCLQPSATSSAYDVTASWDHEGADANGSTLPVPTKPPNGSTYTLTLRDHATNAVLFEQASRATYADLPDRDGCHPDCWHAQVSIDGGGGAGEGGSPVMGPGKSDG